MLSTEGDREKEILVLDPVVGNGGMAVVVVESGSDVEGWRVSDCVTANELDTALALPDVVNGRSACCVDWIINGDGVKKS